MTRGEKGGDGQDVGVNGQGHSTDNNLPESFLQHFIEASEGNFGAHADWFQGEPPDIPIERVLWLRPSEITPFAHQLLSVRDEQGFVKDGFEELARGVRAYFEFQDILDTGVGPKDSVRMFNRNYCYYEGMLYLRESIKCWLQGNILAALTLLRPFLELSMFHLYWCLRTRDQGNKAYYRWFDGKKAKPPFKQAVDLIHKNLPGVENLPPARLKHGEELVLNAYATLCSYNHTPLLDESTQAQGNNAQLSLETFYYWLQVALVVLRRVVLSYVLTYPMSLFPVDRMRKWGFGGPSGLLFDERNHALLVKYLGATTVERLKGHHADLDEVTSLLEWAAGLPDLSEEAIEQTWEQVPDEMKDGNQTADLGERIARHKAHFRLLGWIMNYRNEKRERTAETGNELLDGLLANAKDW